MFLKQRRKIRKWDRFYPFTVIRKNNEENEKKIKLFGKISYLNFILSGKSNSFFLTFAEERNDFQKLNFTPKEDTADMNNADRN